MVLGSRERAGQDSLKHSLKRRLPDLEHSVHRRYIEIECHRIVETLRVIRDEYRCYLEGKGCKPISEMYWVVFRFGVVQYAVTILRAIAEEYVVGSKVPFIEWEVLYGSHFLPKLVMGSGPLAKPASTEILPDTPTPESINHTICRLIRKGTFEQVLDGGPFGEIAQMYLARRIPNFDFWRPGVNLLQIVKKRQLLWRACKPWTTGLATLFNTTQEELDFEYSLLALDAKRVESAFMKLSAFERIAHEYLVDLRRRNVDSRNLGERDWLDILGALDTNGVTLEGELTGISKRVLEAVRRKGKEITTWKACYLYRARVQMDGKGYSLRREITHAVHNAAKRANYQLGKVWSAKRK